MPELKDREIFSAGTWNGLDFDKNDLEEIAENYDKLSDEHKVPLKFGHNKDQKVTDGQPAIGWVSRVYVNGTKLFADFSDVPKVVFNAIKNKLYRTVSIELLFGVKKDGTRFNHILDAVALLGADKPAVSNLADLDALLATRANFDGGRRLVFETIAGSVKTLDDEEEDDMPISEEKFNKLVASVDELGTKIDEKDKEIDELKKENDSLKAKNQKFTEDKESEKVKTARDDVNQVLDAAVKQKTLTPAGREAFEKQFGVDDDEQVVKIDLDNVKAMFSVKKINDDKENALDKDKDDENLDNPEEELFSLVNKNMAETGEEKFEVAFMRVAKANPKLHKAYLDLNGEV